MAHEHDNLAAEGAEKRHDGVNVLHLVGVIEKLKFALGLPVAAKIEPDAREALAVECGGEGGEVGRIFGGEQSVAQNDDRGGGGVGGLLNDGSEAMTIPGALYRKVVDMDRRFQN